MMLLAPEGGLFTLRYFAKWWDLVTVKAGFKNRRRQDLCGTAAVRMAGGRCDGSADKRGHRLDCRAHARDPRALPGAYAGNGRWRRHRDRAAWGVTMRTDSGRFLFVWRDLQAAKSSRRL